MSRFYQTPRGRISNAGDLPRFIGLFPCSKAEGGVLVFSSITELRVAEYLAWSPQVVSIAFEAGEVSFEAKDGLPPIAFWPDFQIVLEGGELAWVEAKYAEHSLSDDKRGRLATIAAHCKRENRRYEIVYREELEKNGFSGTISLLRLYGELPFSEGSLSSALERLRAYGATYIENWVQHAREHSVAIDSLYHLLYHQRLPLLFRPLIHPELALCRG